MTTRTPTWKHVYPDPIYKWPWEDLRAPATSINPPGADSDADIDPADGTLLFASNVTETIAVLLQMPHGWREGSAIRPHLHWSKTTDAAGDVVWQIKYRVFNAGDVPPDFSDFVSATSRSEEPGSTQKHVIEIFPEIDMTGKSVSCMLSVVLQRDHDAAADDYEADARVWEFDVHYQIDSLGSIQEYTKETVS